MRLTSVKRSALFAVLALVTAAGPALAQDGDAKRGQQLFVTNGCYSCHGTRGNGGGVAGPRIAPPLPKEAFVRQLRQPVQKMPPFSAALLSDADIADLMAYLRTTPKSPSAADIPILRNAPG